MRLYFAALAARIAAQLFFHGIEGIAQGDEEILMGLLVMLLAVDHQLAARQRQVDPHRIELPLVLAALLTVAATVAFDTTWQPMIRG